MSTHGSGESGNWRDPEFGHGQQRYYGDSLSPAPGEESVALREQSRKGSRWPAIAGVGVLAVVVAGGGLLIASMTGGDASPVVQPPQVPISPSATTSTSSSPTEQVNDGKESDSARFTVPPDGSFKNADGEDAPIWGMPEDPRDIAGYGVLGKKAAAGHSPTTYRDDYCADYREQSLGMVVFASTKGGTALQEATRIGDKWLEAVATRDDGKVEKYDKTPTVKQVTLADSGTKAVQYRGRTPITEEDLVKCGVDEAEVVVTTLDTKSGPAAVVAVRILGHPDSMSDTQLDDILNSIRPDGDS